MRILVLLLFASIASAQQTPTSINSLPAAAPLTGTEAIPCEQGGTKKCTVAQITTQTVGTLAPSATIDATNATNITKGTLPCAQLPSLTGPLTTVGCATTLGNIPADDITGLAPSATIDATNASNISSGTLGPARLPPIPAADVTGLAPSATTDTTNASNISSGTLGAALLPNPTASTLGGIESITQVAHNFLTSISTSGVPAQAQPAATDISGLAPSATTDTTNASNIASGTLASARLPGTIAANTTGNAATATTATNATMATTAVTAESTSGNSATATALAATPSACSSQIAIGIAANGNANCDSALPNGMGYGVNVFTYGAKCDGSTDDTTAFQNAAAAIPTVGGTLLIPSGANCVIGGWVQLKSNTTVSGWGATVTANVTTLAAGGWYGPCGAACGKTSPVFGPAANATNGGIYGVTFVYPNYGSSGQTNANRAIELLTGNSYWVFDHNTYYGGGGDFIANIGATQVWMTNNIAGTSSHGLTNSCYDNWNSYTDVLVAGNICYMNATAGNNGGGIQFTGVDTGGTVGTSFGSIAIDNTVYVARANDQGINVNGYATCGTGIDSRWIVANNKILVTLPANTSGSAYAILISGCAQNGDVHDNYCEQVTPATSGTGPYGAACVSVQSPAYNVKVHHNTAVNWAALAANGVFDATGLTSSLVENSCFGCTIGSTLVAATDQSIIGTNTANGTLIAGNDVGDGVYNFQSSVSLGVASGYGYVLSQSGVPFILDQCTISAVGALSACTSLPATYANAYMYFPAATLASTGVGSAAGFYFVQMSSATAGTAFLNAYSAGNPAVPGSPTAVTAATAGTVNPGTGAVTLYNVSLPANALGLNGELVIETMTQQANSSGTKAITIKVGAATVYSMTPTTVATTSASVRVRNANAAAAQTVNSTTSQATSTNIVPANPNHQTVNTATAQTVAIGTTLNTPATDYQVFEGFSIKVFPN